ncbi:hypothetical protein CYCD_21570 [Tenuifilaceae bacterium CYCD]|nr:hypothetical protein CYCD_21570 [Tenuifilaceae bacterium CYCD]
MTKKTTIIISLLLIIAAVIIEILLKESKTSLDIELLEFFAGILFGAGISLPIHLFFGKNKK